jgi:short-subunit dehydrogenase
MSETQRPVAVITGATRGIGLGIATSLAATHHIVAGGRNRDSVEALVRELPSATGFVADLGDLATLDAAVAELAANTPRVDVLVNSAGVVHRGSLADSTTSDWVEALTINVVGVAAVTRALLPGLRAAKGLVLMVNSGSGFNATATSGVYSASKFALRALTDALREEERANGVRVTSLHPGRTDTDMQREMVAWEGCVYDPSSFLTVESVVRAARAAIDASPEASLDVISVRPRGQHA